MNNTLMNTTQNTPISEVPDVEVAIQQWNAYQNLCKGILNNSDYQRIQVKEKDENGNYVLVEREFKKKSAWQKLARAFNVDTSIVDRELERTKTGRIQEAYYCVRATLPNGRSVESDAICSRHEKGKANISDHSIMATAKTRATNRAIAELIGAGETSSEEMTADNRPYTKEELPDYHIQTNPPKSETPKEETIPAKAEVVDGFETAAEIKPDNDDHIAKNYCQAIKELLEKDGQRVTKFSMKTRALSLMDEGEIDSAYEDRILKYITKHCPEDLN